MRRWHQSAGQRLRRHQAQVIDHRLEVAVVVQQPAAVLDTEGADPHIHRLADGNSLAAERAIILGRLYRDPSRPSKRKANACSFSSAAAAAWSLENPWRMSMSTRSPRRISSSPSSAGRCRSPPPEFCGSRDARLRLALPPRRDARLDVLGFEEDAVKVEDLRPAPIYAEHLHRGSANAADAHSDIAKTVGCKCTDIAVRRNPISDRPDCLRRRRVCQAPTKAQDFGNERLRRRSESQPSQSSATPRPQCWARGSSAPTPQCPLRPSDVARPPRRARRFR